MYRHVSRTCSWDGTKASIGAAGALLWGLVASACVHAPAPVFHQRVLLAAEQEGVRVAELRGTAGGRAELAEVLLGPCGPERVVPASHADAHLASVSIHRGQRLETVLPASLQVQPAPAWSSRVEAAGSGWLVEVAPFADRYGKAQVARLVAPEGDTAQLARLPPDARVEVAAVAGGQVVARVEGPGTLRDVRVLDLRRGATAIHVARGERALAAGETAQAAAAAAQAVALPPCGLPDGPAWWLQARALLATGAPRHQVLEALESAIRAEPGLYRMYARTSPAFEPLRADPAFVELVRPRHLEGSLPE